MAKKNEITKAETNVVVNDSAIDTSEVLEGIELKKNPMGKFVGKEVDGIQFDSINAVIVGGKFQYVFWGQEEKDKEHKGRFFFDVDSKETAEEMFSQLCVSDNLAELGYTFKDVDERYIILFQDVESGAPFFLSMSKSGKSEFLNYHKKIKYGLAGNKNKALSQVVTKISTQAKSSGSFNWIAEKFDFVEDVK